MKVAHLVAGGAVAGGQVVALRLAEGARAAGHEALFVSPTPGPFVERVREADFPGHVVPLGRALDVRSLARLRRLLRSQRVDLLHTHTHFSLNVLGRLAGRAAGAVVVAHLHIENVFREDAWGRVAQVRVDNATARLCAAILAVSAATRESLLRQGYPAERVGVVPNGVAGGAPAPPRRPDGVPANAPLVVHVGRLAPVKGQRELLDALALLEGVYAAFVGEDFELRSAYRAELEEHARRLGVADRVVFTGRRDDVPELLAGADVLALPSWIEGLPLVVLEAMAQGKPVVATAVGGVPELVAEGETGLLVPPRDASALAEALARIVGDGESARALGEAGRRRVAERFSDEAMVRRVLAVYDEVAGA